MKQLESVAPDFSELLKCIQDIISVNKPFYDVQYILIISKKFNFSLI